MTRILLVDDDPLQLDMWTLLFRRAGHEIETAETRSAATERLRSFMPDVLVMDLGLPTPAEGEQLMAEARRIAPGMRIVLLTGAPEMLSELATPDEIFHKPVRVEQLLEAVTRLALVLLMISTTCLAQRFPFRVGRSSEVIAELEMSAPEGEWALAELTIDLAGKQHALAWGGAQRRGYAVFLGRLDAGEHVLEAHDAPGLRVHGAKFREMAPDDKDFEAIAHAPVLYAREDTVGTLNDAPLLMYCERLGTMLQYTAIFSNEDGGTSTRALMARWGRTTDIEYIYRHDLATGRATIQAKDHREIAFDGKRDGTHPILMPVTKNNMVSAQGTSAVRYQLAPVTVDLTRATRESVMDAHPDLYRVMARELEREDKLRPFGSVAGENISDPRNYLYLDFLVQNRQSAVGVLVRLQGDRTWRSSHLGRPDYAIERDGWVRSTVELPPGTKASQVAEVAFECLVARKGSGWAGTGTCTVLEWPRAFLLDTNYRPGPNLALLWKSTEIPAGAMVAASLRQGL